MLATFDIDKSAAAFHSTIEEMTNRHFPVTWHWVRSTDDPWIDAPTRAMIHKRQRLFARTQKGCKRWKSLKVLTKNMIRNRKKKLYDKEVASHAIPYEALKNIADTERPPTWNICHLASGRSDEALADEAADFFSSISQEFVPLDKRRIPQSYDTHLPDLSTIQVAEGLRSIKKLKSSVRIDPLPCFLGKHADKRAEAVTPILNGVRRGLRWLRIWKEEEGTIIPKKAAPTSLNECRNIS